MPNLHTIFTTLYKNYQAAAKIELENKKKFEFYLIQEMLGTLKAYEKNILNNNDNIDTNIPVLELQDCEKAFEYLLIVQAGQKEFNFMPVIQTFKKYLSISALEEIKSKFSSRNNILRIIEDNAEFRTITSDEILLLCYAFRFELTVLDMKLPNFISCFQKDKENSFLTFRKNLPCTPSELQVIGGLKALVTGQLAHQTTRTINWLVSTGAWNLFSFLIAQEVFDKDEILSITFDGTPTSMPLPDYILHGCTRADSPETFQKLFNAFESLLKHHPLFLSINLLIKIHSIPNKFPAFPKEQIDLLFDVVFKHLNLTDLDYMALIQFSINAKKIDLLQKILQKKINDKIFKSNFEKIFPNNAQLTQSNIYINAVGFAAKNNNFEAIKILHEHGFSLALPDSLKKTSSPSPLILAIIFADDACVSYLLEKNVGLDDLNYTNAILFAAYRETPIALNLLVEKLKNSSLLSNYISYKDFFAGLYHNLISNNSEKMQRSRIYFYENFMLDVVKPELIQNEINFSVYVIQMFSVILQYSKRVIRVAELFKKITEKQMSFQNIDAVCFQYYLDLSLNLWNKLIASKEKNNENKNSVSKKIEESFANYFKAPESVVKPMVRTFRFYHKDVEAQYQASLDILMTLLVFNFNVNQKYNINGHSVNLIFSCCFLNYRPLIEKLLEKGAEIPDELLGYCIKEKLNYAIDVLLNQKNTNVNTRNYYGYSPLDFAVLNNDELLIERILEKLREQVDPTIVNQHVFIACNLFEKDTSKKIKDLLIETLPLEAKKKIHKKIDKNHPYNISLAPLLTSTNSNNNANDITKFKLFSFKDDKKTYTARIKLKDWDDINMATGNQVENIVKENQESRFSFFGPKIKKIGESKYKIRPSGSNARLILQKVGNEENILEGKIEWKHKK